MRPTLLALLVACGESPPRATVTACAPIAAAEAPDATGTQARSYYDCLEASLADGEGCGPDGYPLGYGGKYAERFVTEARPRLSPEGRAWLDDVLVCLQEALAARLDDDSTCDDAWRAGFDTHPACYVDAGFCELSLDDVLVVGTTIDPVDLSLPDQQAQVEAVNRLCEARP